MREVEIEKASQIKEEIESEVLNNPSIKKLLDNHGASLKEIKIFNKE